MTARIDLPKVVAALGETGAASSDFDLNPEVRARGPRTLRDAGVLVPIVEREEGLRLILTKRSSSLRHHPGQIAFPGGRVDPIDIDYTDAALREAEEEIGLPRANVEIIGALPVHETVTNYNMYPVVGLIRTDFEPRPEAGEVAEIFEVPLAHVLNVENFRVESRRWQGRRRYYFTVPYGPYYIWGATARVLRGFAERMSG